MEKIVERATPIDMDARIEAAARQVGEFLGDHGDGMYRLDAEEILRAAFPELFNGTGWIAPWALDPNTEAGCQEFWGDWLACDVWEKIRDDHLASKEGE